MKRYILIAAMTAALGTQAFASLTLLTDRSQVGATADLGIAQFGLEGASVASGTVGTTTGTDIFNVALTAEDMVRTDAGSAWSPTEFANGDPLIVINGSPIVKFSSSKSAQAVGLEIETSDLDVFTINLEAFDGFGDSLGVVSINTDDLGYGFIGARSNDVNILSFSVWSDDERFAFNHVSYQCCNPVPEPASMALLALGGIAALRRKRSR